jgi:SAM-dependent methyltransferase
MSKTMSLLKARFDPNSVLYSRALRKALQGCDSVLDIGCGASGRLRRLGIRNTTGFEGYKPDFEEAQRLKTHDHLVHGDARDLPRIFQPRQFDVCVAVDVIEHFTKADGLKLMQDMERIARKRVVFFTPKGFMSQMHTTADDDLQMHLSGWEPAEMKGYGYEVSGQLGPQSLRGEGHNLKYRPKLFWSLISCLGQLTWSHSHPEQAAAILCVKNLG